MKSKSNEGSMNQYEIAVRSVLCMKPGLSQELIKMNSWQFRGSIVIARRQMITIHSTMDAASTRVCHLQSDRQFYCFLVQMLDKRIKTCCLVLKVSLEVKSLPFCQLRQELQWLSWSNRDPQQQQQRKPLFQIFQILQIRK